MNAEKSHISSQRIGLGTPNLPPQATEQEEGSQVQILDGRTPGSIPGLGILMLETVLAGLKWTGFGLLGFSISLTAVGIAANKASEIQPLLLQLREPK